MKKYIIPLSATIIFLFFFIEGKINENNTINDHGFATGQVYDCEWGSRAGVTLHYNFKLDDERFNGSKKLPIAKQFAYLFKGKNFPVAFNTKDPSLSILLVNPKDFGKYGLEFPDSLNWVKEYFF